jgi:dienelactone hydrolase
VDNVGLAEQPDAVNQQALTTPVVGMLYEPAGRKAQPVPAMLFLGGSGGGNQLSELAKHYAAQGFVTLSLCYFGCPGRPSALAQIPLEYVLSAVGYLHDLPEVDPASVNVYGISRGAELALLIGSHTTDVRGVVSVYGAPWVFGAVAPANGCGWTLNGACVPVGTPIAVQQIRGPVLLFHGQFDALWPMAYSEQISAELDSALHPHSLVVFPNVGHAFDSLGCLIGTRSCTDPQVPGWASVPWNAVAHVNATRIMFAQVLTLLRSETAGTTLDLPPSIGMPPALPAPVPGTPAPTPTGPPGTVILQDVAARVLPSSTDLDQRSRRYDGDNYVVSVPALGAVDTTHPNELMTALPGTYADAALSADVQLANPAADQYVTLACRSQMAGSEYRFSVLPAAGQFAMARSIDLQQQYVTDGLQGSTTLRTADQTNHIELRCRQDRIEGLINGSAVWSVSDYTFSSGGLWFAVGQAPATPNRPASSGIVQAEFRNLVVTQQ